MLLQGDGYERRAYQQSARGVESRRFSYGVEKRGKGYEGIDERLGEYNNMERRVDEGIQQRRIVE